MFSGCSDWRTYLLKEVIMQGHTEEYKNGRWVEAEPMKASWENNPLYKLKGEIKLGVKSFLEKMKELLSKYERMGMNPEEVREKVYATMNKCETSPKIYFDEFNFAEVSNMERTEDTAVLKTNPKFCILAGYAYGKELWKECFSYLNYHKPFKMVIPSHIEGMSISFIGGLFEEMIENIGVDKLLERITIIHPDEEFIKHVIDDIKMYK